MEPPTRPRLVLASASPRRADLLRAAGIPFDRRAAAVDETRRPGEAPAEYVRRLARAKAEAVDAGPDEVVLGADTAVVVGEACLGKPADRAEAAAMLRLLAGRSHEVLTGVALIGGGVEAVEVVATVVGFAPLTEAEIAWYVATSEPYDKAGGYAVQGLASRYVTTIEGSYSNVVGLPVELVYRWLRAGGHGLLA